VDEASPGSSREYEWHEAPLSTDDEHIHSLRDGMALLSTDPSESGYIGITHHFMHLLIIIDFPQAVVLGLACSRRFARCWR
jgi:hypothetical protein